MANRRGAGTQRTIVSGFVRLEGLFVPGEAVFGRTGRVNLSAVCPVNIQYMSAVCPVVSGGYCLLWVQPHTFGDSGTDSRNVWGFVRFCEALAGCLPILRIQARIHENVVVFGRFWRDGPAAKAAGNI